MAVYTIEKAIIPVFSIDGIKTIKTKDLAYSKIKRYVMHLHFAEILLQHGAQKLLIPLTIIMYLVLYPQALSYSLSYLPG